MAAGAVVFYPWPPCPVAVVFLAVSTSDSYESLGPYLRLVCCCCHRTGAKVVLLRVWPVAHVPPSHPCNFYRQQYHRLAAAGIFASSCCFHEDVCYPFQPISCLSRRFSSSVSGSQHASRGPTDDSRTQRPPAVRQPCCLFSLTLGSRGSFAVRSRATLGTHPCHDFWIAKKSEISDTFDVDAFLYRGCDVKYLDSSLVRPPPPYSTLTQPTAHIDQLHTPIMKRTAPWRATAVAAVALGSNTACGWVVTNGGSAFGPQLSRSSIRTVGGSLASSAGGSAWTSRVSIQGIGGGYLFHQLRCLSRSTGVPMVLLSLPDVSVFFHRGCILRNTNLAQIWKGFRTKPSTAVPTLFLRSSAGACLPLPSESRHWSK